jgi:hypothetical protein
MRFKKAPSGAFFFGEYDLNARLIGRSITARLGGPFVNDRMTPTRFLTVLLCWLGLMLAGSPATADEPPATTPDGTPAPAAPLAAPAADAATPATHKVLLLPMQFTVYQTAVGSGLEAVPDWTEAARTNLASSLGTVLQTKGAYAVVPMPELSAAEQATLRDELGLARVIVSNGAHYRHGDWHKHRENFDPSIGDGLGFLHERTQADYAVLVDGLQIKQSGGTIFMQIALAAAGVAVVGGAGTTVSVAVIDLNQGVVSWFNHSIGVEAFGISGTDVRNPATAQSVLTKLLSAYPSVPALAD